jgi:sugar phosphate isomerase/epimerase
MKTKSTRRDFLRLSATGALGAFVISRNNMRPFEKLAGGSPVVDMKSYGIGLQLYTIRDVIFKDVPGSLKKVSDIGYKYVELADYHDRKFYGYEPSDFKKLVNDLEMDILSSHAGIDPKGNVPEQAKIMAEDHAKLGAKYCMHPWVEVQDRSLAYFQELVKGINVAAPIMKDQGIEFGYHNHNFEFATIDGVVPYFDIFLKDLDKNLTTMELDLFWTTKAGQDPVEIFEKYPGRFQLFHMKDMYTHQAPFYKTETDDFAPVGEGVIDFKRILAARDVAGNKYLIVEQDNAGKGDPFEAIRESIINLVTKILV